MQLHTRALSLQFVAFLILFSLGCATVPPESQSLAVQPLTLSGDQELAFDRVLILTDASSSMYAQPTASARALTESIVAGLPVRSTGIEVGAMAFGGTERRTLPIELVDRDKLLAYARSLRPMGGISGPATGQRSGGTTPIDQVLDEAAQMLQGGSGRAAVILISDGAATLPDRALTAAQRLSAGQGEGNVCLFTIRVGESADGGALARELSAASGCGTSVAESRLRADGGFDSYREGLFAMRVPRLPPVAAPPPCETRMELHNIEFGFDEATLTTASRAELARIGAQLQDCRDARVEIGGYTDSTGDASYNVGLSERRAKAARDALLNAGATPGQLSTRGYGDSDPVASNATREGRAKNRRVEFHGVE